VRPSAGELALDRRSFVRSVAALAAGVVATHASAAGATIVEPARLDVIGLQLYTLRDLASRDVEATLAAVAGIGYREIEFAGLYGRTPAEMRAILDRNGLRAVSSHHSLQDVRERWTATLDGAAELGQQYVVVASIGGDDADSMAALERTADAFNHAGETAKAHGLQFGYHNHDFEFKPIDGRLPYDVLLAKCDAGHVIMEMDLFWIVNGGRDPLKYFAAHPGRFPLIHAKDRTADGRMVNVGEGVIDFRRILGQSRQAGIRHVFVEHDRPASPIEDVRASYRFLEALPGA
jgi:sugar phosphate isomerase/epimerase